MNENQAETMIQLLEGILNKMDELISCTNYISDNKSWNLYYVKSAIEDVESAIKNLER